MKNSLFYCLVSMVLLPQISSAQRMLGVSTDSWSGSRQLYLNPAAVADQKNRFTVDLFAINFGLDNNTAAISPGKAIRQFTSGDSMNLGDVFSFSPKDKFNMIAPSVEFRGPGALVRINDRHSLALTTRVRAMNRINNFSQKFYRSLTDIDFGKEENNYTLSTGAFDWSAQMWSELGLSYATTVFEKGQHRIKAGVTVRYLGGIGYLNVNCDNMDIRYYGNQDSIRVTNTDVSFSSNVVGDDDVFSGVTTGELMGRFFGKKGGAGLGGDIGVIYEFLEEESGPYRLRASASVVDIGKIKYKNNNRTAFLRGDGSMNTRELGDNVQNFDDFKNYVQERGISVDTSTGTTKMQLPTAMILGADYHAWKSLYVNALFIGNLMNQNKPGTGYYSQFTLTPRYESKLLSVALPLTYSALTGGVKMGLGIRVSGFFIGSDDLPVFGKRKYGFNGYFGACVPFYRKDSKERS